MIEEDLFELLDSVLKPLGATIEDGDESRSPPLEVLRYYVRPVRLSAVPIVGRGLSVVAVARQPIDVAMGREGYRALVERLAGVVNTRFPPIRAGRGLTLGLSAVIATPEPIAAGDEAVLGLVLDPVPRNRVVPLGVLRLNLGQEALAIAMRRGPDGLFPEGEAMADALSLRLRRFLPLLEM